MQAKPNNVSTNSNKTNKKDCCQSQYFLSLLVSQVDWLISGQRFLLVTQY